jgi:large subunit ribosomal protein L30
MAHGKIRIKLVRSPIVRALGLRKLNQVVEKPDIPAFRGMVAKAPHLLSVVD